MNIKALRAFRITVSEGSLVATSNIMHLSQPAISRLISGLESELKLTLFDRSGRNLTPTREGLAFFRQAGRILDNLDEIPTIAADIRSGRMESLRIVTMPRIAQALSVPAVARFIKQSPDINITLDVRARREAGKWLAGREYDIGIGALPVEHPEIRTVPLLKVQAQALLPIGHRFAGRRSISVEELLNEPIISLMQGLLLREQLDDAFKSAGVIPNQTYEVASSHIACALVAEGAGITIADELVASQVGIKEPYLVPIKPERWMTFGLLYPANGEKSQVLSDFETILHQHVQALVEQSDTLQCVSG